MTFLNPFLLFGLAAAAIPILIHLLNKRKLRTIEFSTLSFLKELQKNKMRKLTLRQWLLLLLRTLIIVCLVLAFSRPALQGNFGAIGTHAKTTLVIILDNTASMDMQNEGGKFLAQAKTRAMEIVSLLQENDDVFFLRLSDLPDATTSESTHDIDKLRSLIQGTVISNHQGTIENALELTSQFLSRSKNYNKEIYVFTDGQKTTLTTSEDSKAKSENLFGLQIKLFFERLSDHSNENVGIEKVTILPSLMQLNKQITLNAVVKNYGLNSVKNHIVGITLNNNRIMQKSISLNGGESATIDFTVIPTRTGFLSGFVDSEDDPYEPDNKWYFSFYIPEKIRVALISEKEEYRRYLSAALTVAEGINGSSLVNLTSYAPSQISNSILSSTDILIFSGVYNLSQEQQKNIVQYISAGGSLMFFPGDDTSKSTYGYLNTIGISPTHLISSPQSPIRFENVDLKCPIFTGMFETSMMKPETIESPDITKTLSFQNSNAIIRPIISLTNGQPFLWQSNYQSGAILGFSVPATTTWSNFPLKGIFVPLVYQSVLYLTSQVNLTSHTMNYTAGEKIEFLSTQIIRKSQSENPLMVVDSKQRTAQIHSAIKNRGNISSEKIFSIPDVPLIGEHFILQGSDTVQCFPINISRLESNTDLATEGEITALVDTLGIKKESLKFLTPQTSLRETIAQSRFGIELWRYFALLAIIIALCEMIVAREKKE